MEKKNWIAVIPPNYDDGDFKLGGFITWRTLIEALVTTAVVFLFSDVILPDMGMGGFRVVLMLMLTLASVVVTLTGIQGKSPFEILKDGQHFIRNRCQISYRSIRRRVKCPQVGRKEINRFKKKKYTQQMVPVKKIYKNMVAMKDGRYVKILEFEAIDFIAMKEEEKREVMAEFTAYNRIFEADVQWKKMVFPEDGIRQSVQVKKLMAKHSEESGLYKLAASLDKMLSEWGRRQVLKEPCYLILSWLPESRGDEQSCAWEAFEKLEQEAHKAVEFLSRCGNKNVEEADTAVFLYTLYYRFFNRKSSLQENFYERFKRVTGDFKKIRDEEDGGREIGAHHFLAPRGIEMKHRRYMVMDGMYMCFFVLKDFPEKVPYGWLYPFMHLGDGYDVDVFLKRPDQNAFRMDLSRQISKKEGDIGAMPESSVSAQEALAVYQWNRQMQQAMLGGGNVFYFSVMVTVFSKTQLELEKRKTLLRDLARGRGFDGEFITHYDQALQSAVPSGRMSEALFETYKRNVLDDGAAALYPLTSVTVKNDQGILLGLNRENHTAVTIDFFDPISNMLIFGATGHGKTYLAMLIAIRLRLMETQVFVMAPTKGFEYRALCESAGGSFISIGASNGSSINIMEIRPVYEMGTEEGKEMLQTGRDRLSEKIQQLQEFFKVIVPEIDSRTLRRLDPVLEAVYAEFGITHDRYSIYQENDPEKGLKKMPVIGDLSRILHQEAYRELHWLLPEIERLVSGSLQCFNRETDVDLNNLFCVLDLSALQPEIFPIGLFIVESYLWDVIRQDRLCKKAVIFEEMWKFLKNSQSEGVIQEIYKTIRGYRGIAVGVTQEIGDLFSCASGKTIFDQSRIKVSMYMEKEGARELKRLLEWSDYHYHSVIHAEPGEALICTKEEHHRVKIKATEAEAFLLETDGNALERRLKNERESRPV